MRARVDDCAVLLAVLMLTDLNEGRQPDADWVGLVMGVPSRTARRSLGRLTRCGVLRESRVPSGGMGAPRKVWEVVG